MLYIFLQNSTIQNKIQSSVMKSQETTSGIRFSLFLTVQSVSGPKKTWSWLPGPVDYQSETQQLGG